MRNQLYIALLAAVTVLPQAAFAQATPSDFTYAYRYDSMGRVTGTIAPDPDGGGPLHYAAVRNTYDSEGRVIKMEQGELSSWPGNAAPTGWNAYGFVGSNIFKVTDTTYDTAGRKLTEKVSSSNGTEYSLVQYSYDAVGRADCTAIRMNPAAYGSLPGACTPGSEGSYGPDRITHNVYDAASQLLKIQRAYGTSIQQDYATYTYSQNGKQTTVTDARNNTALMTYDGFDRLSQWNFPSPTNGSGNWSNTDYEQYGYDANSNRTSLRKRDTRTISYSYDALNRVTLKGYPGGGATPVAYGYDLMGHTTQIKFNSLSGQGMTRTYNGFGALLSDQVNLPGISQTLGYLYDVHNNRTQMTFGGGTVTYAPYDGLDRPTTISRSGSTIASYTYNAAGQRASFGGGYTTNYGYDPVGRLTSQSITPANASYQVSYGFSHNPSSQIIHEWRDNGLYAWTGASVNDSYGTANGLNQYPTVAGSSFTYDTNGNLTFDGTTNTTYCYDIENRLIANNVSCTPVLSYDPLGRLYEIASGGSATKLIYDGDALVMETNASGTIQRRYVHGTDAGDDPIAWYEGSGFTDSNERLLRPDHQGSIVVVANHDTSTVYATNTYDEYGVPGPSNLGRFQYTGQQWIEELALYHYKARAYSPRLGRFLQTDPVGYKDDINLYTYVHNDPLNGTDPTGLGCGTHIDGVDDVNCTSTIVSNEPKSPPQTQPQTQKQYPADAPLQDTGDLLSWLAGLLNGSCSKGVECGTFPMWGTPQGGAANAANAVRLAEQLTFKQATSLSKATGELTKDAIKGAREIIPPAELNNPAIPAGFGKYTTGSFPTPSGGSFDTHFYMNSSTGEVFYGLDYKSIINFPK